MAVFFVPRLGRRTFWRCGVRRTALGRRYRREQPRPCLQGLRAAFGVPTVSRVAEERPEATPYHLEHGRDRAARYADQRVSGCCRRTRQASARGPRKEMVQAV